jgi:hypothetical protein
MKGRARTMGERNVSELGKGLDFGDGLIEALLL